MRASPSGYLPRAMSNDGRPRGLAIHASAVAIEGRAIVIFGAAGAGKSTLAAGLVAASTSYRPIKLIGDDRILLVPKRGGGLAARPHPRIAGFIERRGLGLVAMRFTPEAPVVAVVDLGDATARTAALQNFPVLSLLTIVDAACRVAQVLTWPVLSGGHAAVARHSDHRGSTMHLDRDLPRERLGVAK